MLMEMSLEACLCYFRIPLQTADKNATNEYYKITSVISWNL